MIPAQSSLEIVSGDILSVKFDVLGHFLCDMVKYLAGQYLASALRFSFEGAA